MRPLYEMSSPLYGSLVDRVLDGSFAVDEGFDRGGGDADCPAEVDGLEVAVGDELVDGEGPARRPGLRRFPRDSGGHTVELMRIELTTSSMPWKRSSQLSYSPKGERSP